MKQYDARVIMVFLIISVVALFLPMVIFLIRKGVQKSFRKISRFSNAGRILIFSACFIASVWCIRYAVGYYMLFAPDSDTASLTWYEEIFNSMVHTFQTFSMDEDYTAYITNGKMMLAEMYGESSALIGAYGLFASVLNFIAPIIGGAIIFDILASIFPKIRLRFSYLAFFKEKYFFSELNESSVALAESISKISYFHICKPILVFTDATIDEDDDKRTELLLQAKSLGAICIVEDLSHTKKNRLGKRRFFLIDEEETNNLRLLSDLTDTQNCSYLKGAEIYLFTHSDTYTVLEENIQDKLISDCGFKEKQLPVLIPVHSYNNLISDLLENIPLYEPLINKKKNPDNTRTLALTVVGAGDIGSQMFLSAYWLGQMLDCKFIINVISRESRDEFYDKLDCINPEIRETLIPNNPILKVNRQGDMAEVYCHVNYFQCDVHSAEFTEYMINPRKNIINTDYFFIALGSDTENISVANTVRKYAEEYHLNENAELKTVITYVVYDTELSDNLNRKRIFGFKENSRDIYMQAVGNLRDVYSISNIFLPENRRFTKKALETYGAIQNRNRHANEQKTRTEDMYNYRNGIAKLMHLKYKVYSMGMFKTSIFEIDDSKKRNEELFRGYEQYKKAVLGEILFNSPKEEQEHLTLLNKMAWLEHRRWNGFMRVQGFRKPENYENYATPGVIGSYIQREIKLHPALVECDKNGIKAEISPKGIINKSTLFSSKETEKFDFLDELSYELHKKGLNDFDFKQKEYPISTII